MNLIFQCFCGKQYLSFLDLLDHHFYEHEKELPKGVLDRLENVQTTIGYANTKTWTNVLGDMFNATT
jgi:hypothetical protein